jgi:hypothetical protein
MAYFGEAVGKYLARAMSSSRFLFESKCGEFSDWLWRCWKDLSSSSAVPISMSTHHGTCITSFFVGHFTPCFSCGSAGRILTWFTLPLAQFVGWIRIACVCHVSIAGFQANSLIPCCAGAETLPPQPWRQNTSWSQRFCIKNAVRIKHLQRCLQNSIELIWINDKWMIHVLEWHIQ